MKIALLGDIAFYGKYSVKNNKIYNYFRDVAEKLKEFDYVIGNLEAPFCSSCKPYGCKSAHINAEEANINYIV